MVRNSILAWSQVLVKMLPAFPHLMWCGLCFPICCLDCADVYFFFNQFLIVYQERMCCISSDAFSASSETMIFSLFFNLLMWWNTFVDLCVLIYTCLLEINITWSEFFIHATFIVLYIMLLCGFKIFLLSFFQIHLKTFHQSPGLHFLILKYPCVLLGELCYFPCSSFLHFCV